MYDQAGTMQRPMPGELMGNSEAQLKMELIDIDARIEKYRIKLNSTANVKDRVIYKDEIDKLLIKRQQLTDILQNSRNILEDVEMQLIDIDATIEKLKVKIKHIHDINQRQLYMDEIDKLKAKREVVQDIINKCKSHGARDEGLKGSLENAWSDLKTSMQNFTSRF